MNWFKMYKFFRIERIAGKTDLVTHSTTICRAISSVFWIKIHIFVKNYQIE